MRFLLLATFLLDVERKGKMRAKKKVCCPRSPNLAETHQI
jgi:hypothetical protein